ncbi:hypothetical protein MMC11_008081 [Xylographa trunciseda]|nr:hypothetical protein [Xylographa trunciseda]
MNPRSHLRAFSTCTFLAAALAYPTIGFEPNQLNVYEANICSLDNGVTVQQNADGNLVVYREPNNANTVLWASSKTVPNCNGECNCIFQGDGKPVTYYNGKALFNSGTANRGTLFVCTENAPYLLVYNSAGTAIWSTGTGGTPPKPPTGPCGNYERRDASPMPILCS